MSQFEVYANPSGYRRTIPYVISLQSSRLNHVTTRFVAALVVRSAIPVYAAYLTSTFTVAGRDVVLDLFNMATITTARLGEPIAYLADEDSRAKLVRAMDEFLSQA